MTARQDLDAFLICGQDILLACQALALPEACIQVQDHAGLVASPGRAGKASSDTATV